MVLVSDDVLVLPEVSLRPVVTGAGRLSDPVDPEAGRLIPETTARRYGLLPFAVTEQGVDVAVSQLPHGQAEQVLADLGSPVRLFRCSPTQLQAAQSRVWRPSPLSVKQERPARGGRPMARLLGDLLVEEGRVSAAAVQGALAQQETTGGRLGAILTSTNSLTLLAVAQAVARQHELPLVDLQAWDDGHQRLQTLDPQLFHLMPESFWRDRLLVPLGLGGNQLTVAMVDPSDQEALDEIESATGWRVRPVVTAYRDVMAALRTVYSAEFSEESRFGLFHARPDDSASFTLTASVKRWGIGLGVVTIGALGVRPLWTLIALNAAAQVSYLGLAFFKLGLLARLGRKGGGIEVSGGQLAELDRATLPIYTVLVPAYRETRVLPVLARALSELEYPHDRLDVKLLLEEDDTEMVAAAQGMNLPTFIDIVLVPASHPRTKPKACNYGLHLSRGEYTVIFDAEDIPEPTQLLKAVVAFRDSSDQVACVQAKLAYFNRNQNLLTRWFTAEYLMWFDLLLPALHASPVPIPLGGTSNHFRTHVLREVGAWDPFNVAEDADLGIRLHKAGYKTAIMDATTYEEATSRVGNWVRQRSRWIKGYMQTWLVHMRHPVALWTSLGPAGFLGFQVIVGGTAVTLLLNPVYALLTTLWYLTRLSVLQSPFPGWVYGIAALNLLIGNFAFTYANMAAVARRNIWDLLVWTALSPVYWTLMSVAAWKGFIQLITKPSYWEKTDHGHAAGSVVPGVSGVATGSHV